MNTCFDYRSLAERAGLSSDALRELETCVRRQYGSDEMMIELRLLRTLQAICEGTATLKDAIREFRVNGAPSRGGSPGYGGVTT